ncbi:MAG: LD-carboxypeptidase [Flavobacteriales bacterium]
MKVPPFLKSGDRIGIAATARWVTAEQLQPAIDLFTSWGLRVKVAPNVHTVDFQLAGNTQSRTHGLQQLMDDDDVQAIIIARGGYGTVHTIDALDFTRLLENPKWIAGYSDITVLHAHLNSSGLATIHSTMPISFPDATAEALENLRRCLFGDLTSFASTELCESDFSPVSGNLFGGNLSVLYSLLGSNSWQQQEPVILFIEDVDEMLYHLDRMLWGIYRAGLFSNVRAMVCGGFTQMKDNTSQFGFPGNNPWGANAREIIQAMADRLQIPVAFGFPAGHLSDNRAFYLGRPAQLQCVEGRAEIHY